ncbi:MAG: pilus assembly protein [Actinobacteria bacterium]|nr:MAG: pilus assembly protein [Actinomycetota bacterium]
MKKRMHITREQGQTMTEFAIVLPILVVLLFGIIQFGIAFNNYVTVTDAARAGARMAAVSRNSSDPVGACTNQVRSSASDLDQSKLIVSCSSAWTAGSDVTVDVQYPYSIDLFGVVVKSGNLETVMKERVE